MKKIIDLKDDVTDFALDEVDCFQRPISIVLRSMDKQYSNIFILYAKTLELYTSDTLREIRYNLIDILKHMGVVVEPYAKGRLMNFIYKKIESNNLIIMGIDYNKLFYSQYYKGNSYPHWLIVNGYNSNSKVVSIMDYTQFMDKKFKFEPFVLSNKILKDANREFKNNYGDYDSCFSIGIDDIKKSLNEEVKKLFDFIIEFMEKKEYSILNLFNRLLTLTQIPEVSPDDIKNVETQILNVNKCRKIFFSEIIKQMYLYDYGTELINSFSDKSYKLTTEYNNFSIYCLLRIISGKYEGIKFKELIKVLENEILELIKNFKQHLLILPPKLQTISKRNEKIINDFDDVINLKGEDVFFEFVKNREYNWWENDNAPKLQIVETTGAGTTEISAQIEISKEDNCNNFQVGFYVINGDESYFAGIDFNDKWCLDKINYDNFSCYYNYIPVQKIYVLINSNFLEVGQISGKIKKCILRRFLERKNTLSVGLVCKKWEDYGKLLVKFSDINHIRKE